MTKKETKKQKEVEELKKAFFELFGKGHDYLRKVQHLKNTYINKKARGLCIHWNKAFKNELYRPNGILQKYPLKKYPEIAKAFKLNYKTDKSITAEKKFYDFINQHPKGLSFTDECILYALYLGKIGLHHLDGISKNAHKRCFLEQAIVASCTAFECYARDIITWSLNNIPKYGKKYIGELTIPLKEIGKYKFAPLDNAGEIFLDRGGKNFNVFENGKTLYKKIFDLNIFENREIEKEIWPIYQTRHCIIHNGGLPDKRWKRKMKGKKMKIDDKTTEKYTTVLHNLFHLLYFRTYEKIFNEQPKKFIFIENGVTLEEHLSKGGKVEIAMLEK